MLPDTVAAVAADAAVAVAAAAAAAAAQGRRPLRTREPSFVDGTSYYWAPDGWELEEGSTSSAARSYGSNSFLDISTDGEWQGHDPNEWRYLRLLSGHWSPWTVTLIALNQQPLPSAAWREFRMCKGLLVLHLERCSLINTDFCCDLPNLRRLLLPHNQLHSLRGLKNLPRLEELCVKGNPIYTFKDLAQLTGLPSLKRLDLQAVDGSEAAPVCGERGYQEAVLALLPRDPLDKACGPAACSTRLDVLDGRRLQLPALGAAAAEAAGAAARTSAATRRFRADIRMALDIAARQLSSEGRVSLFPGSVDPNSNNNLEDYCHSPRDSHEPTRNIQHREQQQLAPCLLVPAEACKTLRDLLSREVQHALLDAQTLMQQVRRASAEAKRSAFALGCGPTEASVSG